MATGSAKSPIATFSRSLAYRLRPLSMNMVYSCCLFTTLKDPAERLSALSRYAQSKRANLLYDYQMARKFPMPRSVVPLRVDRVSRHYMIFTGALVRQDVGTSHFLPGFCNSYLCSCLLSSSLC
ncbi:hypothetical protein B0I35DRAFT_447763 [Stachybotrys elegans]|uniref:Uncharacterized protein n=1 Tax=Stachybotrys elegans TaxID=80388 RepID=A0A8K0WIH5_9HYPO|nr:hypothetical protein B0I35DRAFT_447763 [Stachybotrys elegans]